MKKKNLLDSLKNVINHNSEPKLTDAISLDLDRYIQDNLVKPYEALASSIPALEREQEEYADLSMDLEMPEPKQAAPSMNAFTPSALPKQSKRPSFTSSSGSFAKESSLEEHLRQLDDSFSASLLKLIDAKGMTDSECYRKAGIDRRHFSKMRNDSYHPSKSTVLALCIALELTRDESDALLEKAGYALSKSSVQDLIVEYFLEKKQWDIDLVNEALYKYDQPLLGF